MENKLLKYICYLICAVGVLLFGSCQTTKNQTHSSKKYHTLRTRYNPHWNAATSQNTTYYIKKNSTRKSHNGKTMKNRAVIVDRSHDGNSSHSGTKRKVGNKKLDRKINKC